MRALVLLLVTAPLALWPRAVLALGEEVEPSSVATDALPTCSGSILLPWMATRPSCVETPQSQPWLRVARVGLELVLGGAMGGSAEVLGAYVGLSIDVVGGHGAGPGLSIGTALGAALGTAPGVWLAGYALGGDGAFFWTVMGSTVGTGLAATVLGIKSTSGTLALAAMLPVFGAILGYELSSHERRPNDKERKRASVSIVPTVGPTSLGLVGVF